MSTGSTIRPPLSRRKLWAFRGGAILLGLLPFLLCELGLRLAGWQAAAPTSDPFVEFHLVRPLFVRSQDGKQMVIAADRMEYFQPESFALKKASDEFRVFCLGGSTVQGRPYSTETSFTTWLELGLKAADESKQWRVINCGGVSYASYRLAPILEEVLQYEPDLIVLYTGHNEFLEDRSYEGVKLAPTLVGQTVVGLSQLRSVQLVRQTVGSRHNSTEANDRREQLATEVDALLDYQGGLADYHRDDAWRESVVEHFRINLNRMITQSQDAGVPMLLVDPPTNLRNCPPFKVADNDAISAATLATCSSLISNARRSAGYAPEDAANMLQKAATQNSRNAAIHYELGLMLFESKQFATAKRHLVLAKEEDLCPLRIVEPIRQVIRETASQRNVPLLELNDRFDALSEGNIPGDNLFLDHVHPTVRGHQIIAESLTAKMNDIGWIEVADGSRDRRETLFKQHLESLDLVYFERGKQRLEGLQLWTQGRAKKQRTSMTGTEP